MTTEKQAQAIMRRSPRAAHAGWLLAASAPVLVAEGQRMIDRIDAKDGERAILYRDYCLALYATGAKPRPCT